MPPTGASPSRIPAEATTFVGQVTSKRSSLTWEYSSESGATARVRVLAPSRRRAGEKAMAKEWSPVPAKEESPTGVPFTETRTWWLKIEAPWTWITSRTSSPPAAGEVTSKA